MRIQYFPAQWVDQVVTGNCKEMCYEGVHWIGVAHDQMWKWILQTRETSFILCMLSSYSTGQYHATKYRTHALPGQRPMYFVTFSTNTKLRFKIFLVFFLYFYLHEIFGINFPRNTCVGYFCMWCCWESLTQIYQRICCYPRKNVFFINTSVRISNHSYVFFRTRNCSFEFKNIYWKLWMCW